ncbi:hypothetical protein DFJ74DRAFT_769050 [Hyaloraphidium curvatum]|nr:hypothetical protein DFJ74DRAFT_769050 [Hyaloraphidium curvatum]
MGYKRIALAGAVGGGPGLSTGNFILNSLLDKKAAGLVDEILIIGRPPAGNATKQAQIDAAEKRGAHFVGVDYSDEKAVAELLKSRGIECVVSTMAIQDAKAITESEPALVRAAAAAGTVRRFFPSQYGTDITPEYDRRETKEVQARKGRVLDEIKRLGMEWTVVVTSVYYEILYLPLCGYELKPGNESVVEIAGASEPVTGICLRDIGRFVAEMLVDPDEGKSRNRAVKIMGDTFSMERVRKLWEDNTGKRLKVTSLDPASKEARPRVFPRLMHSGHFYIPYSRWDNHNWPQIVPTSLEKWVAEQKERGTLPGAGASRL